MRDMRHERLTRAMVREERLRAAAAMTDASSLSSWRGRSGRRYVVGVHPLSEPDMAELDEAVVIAVRRSGDGDAALLGVASPGRSTPRVARLGWLAGMRARGATEMHVHRLADSESARQAVVADLMG